MNQAWRAGALALGGLGLAAWSGAAALAAQGAPGAPAGRPLAGARPSLAPAARPAGRPLAPLLAFTCPALEGGPVPLSRFAGKVLLIVNTASRCGYTPQYEQLQALHQSLGPKGLAILGFPSNDFLGQEPGSAQDIRQFCTQNYGVSFPLFAKVQVKPGPEQAPLYRFLTEPSTNPRFAGPIGWNFEKFLVDRQGRVVGRYPSRVRPDDPSFVQAVQALL